MRLPADYGFVSGLVHGVKHDMKFPWKSLSRVNVNDDYGDDNDSGEDVSYNNTV